MQTIDLECPSCGEMLDLDAGFAGGVCRCSNCGTLMTVPSDAGQAETLSRPSEDRSGGDGDWERSSDSGLASASGAGSRSSSASRSGSGSSSGSRSRSRSSDRKRGKSSKRKSKAGGRSDAAIASGEYRTASGKVVKLDGTTRVPMAGRKKKQIRLATAAVFFGIVLIGVAAGVAAIVMITGEQAGVDSGAGAQVQVQYDPSANPYDLPVANVAGLPVRGEVAVVVQASNGTPDWSGEMADVLAAGLSKPGEGLRVGFFAASDADASYDGIAVTAADELDAERLSAWFDGLPQQDNEPGFAAAIEEALAGSPGTLILILDTAEAETVAALSSLLSDRDEPTVHAVLLGGAPSALRNWLSERAGSELVLLSARDLENFRAMSETVDEGADEGQ